MATRVRAGRSDKTVMGASRTGSYEVTATRPDVRTDATGHGRQISAKTARRRSALRVRPRPMAPQTSSLSAPRLDLAHRPEAGDVGGIHVDDLRLGGHDVGRLLDEVLERLRLHVGTARVGVPEPLDADPGV